MSSVWIDAQLSPELAAWLPDVLGVPAYPLRDLGLRDADDAVIFTKAAVQGVIMLTKDADFQLLLNRHGPPPRVIWLTCGNTSNATLRTLITGHGSALRAWLMEGSPLIEIR